MYRLSSHRLSKGKGAFGIANSRVSLPYCFIRSVDIPTESSTSYFSYCALGPMSASATRDRAEEAFKAWPGSDKNLNRSRLSTDK